MYHEPSTCKQLKLYFALCMLLLQVCTWTSCRREKQSVEFCCFVNHASAYGFRFYEWKKDGSKKQPYYIHFQDRRPLVFAALYDTWTNSEGQDAYFQQLYFTSIKKDNYILLFFLQKGLFFYFINLTGYCN